MITWSFGKNTYDNQPINQSGTWQDFAKFLVLNRALAKGLNYITSAMGGDGRRCKKNALSRDWLPFDFDGAISDKDAKQLVDFFKGLQTLFYETASSAPNKRKFRFIVACDRAITEDETKALGALMQRLSGFEDGFDKCVHQHSQPIFLPLQKSSVLTLVGDLLPVDELLASIPAPQPKKKPKIKFKTNSNEITPYEFFKDNGLILSESENGIDVICPWFQWHTDEDTSGTVLFTPAPENNMAGGFKCHHSACSGLNIEDIFKRIERNK